MPGPAPSAPRPGPRPLPLHLAILGATWLTSRTALPPWNAGWTPSNAGEAPWIPSVTTPRDGNGSDPLARDLRKADPDALARAVDAAARARVARFLAGVEAYRRHPARRQLQDPPVLWSEGTTRLLDFGPEDRRAPTVLAVPSLINRAYILDLEKRHSLMRHFAARGIRALLVDWGAPGPEERTFSLTDYVAGRLERALEATRRATARPPAVLGYCMGGLLAVALAARRPKDVAGLALLATPWDFHAPSPRRARQLAAAPPPLTAVAGALGGLPVDAIQALFAVLDPYLTTRKFRRFAGLDPAAEAARRFVILEDWLNDGVPLAAPVAEETLGGWYGDNTPARGAWRVDGQIVRPENFAGPALVLVPRRDHIVPPESALALGARLPGASVRTVAAGHIGMVAGSRAARLVYGPLVRWLKREAA